ncbi:MAG: dihydrolipoyl dehydrogenase [Nitrospirae bacterium]|nr:dihydrolipoyl dehydrogenase [Nitrospirota bacterium]
MTESSYDLVVIGAGPGGYVAAIRAAQLGLKTAIIEKAEVGGVCLNRGCIPSKALIRNAEVLTLIRRAEEFGIRYDNLRYDFGVAVERAQEAVLRLTRGVKHLLKKNKVDLFAGTASFAAKDRIAVTDASGKTATLTTRAAIIATGSRNKPLPGIVPDGRLIITSDEALKLNPLPQRLVIVGGGATGVEFAYIFAAYGVQVTIVEVLDRLLPGEDEEISKTLHTAFKKQGIAVQTKSNVASIKPADGGLAIQTESTESASQTINCDQLLLAAGRAGNIEGLGLETLGVKTERGYITTNEWLETTTPGIYAIGDVAGKSLLAHSASAEGITVVERLAGNEVKPINYRHIPRCVYCQPQVASVGLSEADAQAAGYTVKVGKFPFQANGKALALSETEGFIKIVADAKSGECLGVQMIGAEVTELIGEAVLLQTMEGTPHELRASIHPHPTLSEAVMEAAAAVYGEAIHI